MNEKILNLSTKMNFLYANINKKDIINIIKLKCEKTIKFLGSPSSSVGRALAF